MAAIHYRFEISSALKEQITASFVSDLLRDKCSVNLKRSRTYNKNQNLIRSNEEISKAHPNTPIEKLSGHVALYDGYVISTDYLPVFERNNKIISTKVGKQKNFVTAQPLIEIYGKKSLNKNQDMVELNINYNGKYSRRFRRNLLRNAFKAYLEHWYKTGDKSGEAADVILSKLAIEAIKVFGVEQLEKYFKKEIIANLDKYRLAINGAKAHSDLPDYYEAKEGFDLAITQGIEKLKASGNYAITVSNFKDFRDKIEKESAALILSHEKNYRDFCQLFSNTPGMNGLPSALIDEQLELFKHLNEFQKSDNPDIKLKAKAWLASVELPLHQIYADKQTMSICNFDAYALLTQIIKDFADDSSGIIEDHLFYKAVLKLLNRHHILILKDESLKNIVQKAGVRKILNAIEKNDDYDYYLIDHIYDRSATLVYRVKDQAGNTFIVKSWDTTGRSKDEIDSIDAAIDAELEATKKYFQHAGITVPSRKIKDGNRIYVIPPYIKNKPKNEINNLEKFITTASSACEQLAHLHDIMEYYHRDIKPDNILIQDDFSVVFIDFGEITNERFTPHLDENRRLIYSGSPSFFSPLELGEYYITKSNDRHQFYPEPKGITLPEKTDNMHADVYKLGITLLNMLLGGTEHICDLAAQRNIEPTIYRDFLFSLAEEKIDSLATEQEKNCLREVIIEIKKMLNPETNDIPDLSMLQSDLIDILKKLPQNLTTWSYPDKNPVEAQVEQKNNNGFLLIPKDKPQEFVASNEQEELEKYILEINSQLKGLNKLKEKLNFYNAQYEALQKTPLSTTDKMIYSGLSFFAKKLPFGNKLEEKFAPLYIKKLRALKSLMLGDVIADLPQGVILDQKYRELILNNKLLNAHTNIFSEKFASKFNHKTNSYKFLKNALDAHAKSLTTDLEATHQNLLVKQKDEKNYDAKINELESGITEDQVIHYRKK